MGQLGALPRGLVEMTGAQPFHLPKRGSGPATRTGPEPAPEDLTGRRPEIQSIRAALSKESGALLLGEAGVGKTIVARHVLANLADRFAVVKIRGSAVASRSPYGALGVLLGGLPEETTGHPATVMRGLSRVLAQHGDGKPVVLLVDHAEQLDPLTAAVLSQLVVAQAAKILVVARGVAGPMEEFTRLASDGWIRRVDLFPLSLPETGLLLAKRLGGQVSNRLTRMMWRSTLGNPLYLSLLADTQAASGPLRQQEGIWDLTAQPAPSPEIAASVWSRLTSPTAAQRQALEMVALGGNLPLMCLKTSVPPQELDLLEEERLIRVIPGSPPSVRLMVPAVADALRSAVPPSRSRTLCLRALEALDLASMPTDSMAGLAAWASDCGLALPADVVLPAAKYSHDQGDDPGAIKRVRAAGLQAEAEILAGKTSKAQEHIRRLEKILHHAPVPATQRSEARAWLVAVYGWGGELQRVLQLTSGLAESQNFGPAGLEVPGLAHGLATAACGHPDDALQSLVTSMLVLEDRDPHELLPTVLSAAAYCHGLMGNAGRAKQLLNDERRSDCGSRPMEPVRQYFRLLAQAAVGENAGAGLGLFALGKRAAESGWLLAACWYLTAACRLGDHRAARQLLDTVPDNGRWAHTCRLFAAGLLADDGGLLLEAGRAAAELGHGLFGHEAASAALKAFSNTPPDNRRDMRAARELRNATYRRLRQQYHPGYALDQLSDFERELARAASLGASRGDLGHKFHLSPRTVEWHLGKIYAKLHVSSRAELAEWLS